jgi:hypothetical protein
LRYQHHEKRQFFRWRKHGTTLSVPAAKLQGENKFKKGNNILALQLVGVHSYRCREKGSPKLTLTL